MKKQGVSLIAAIFVMVIFLLLGVTLISLFSADLLSSAKGVNYSKAFYAAEGGVTYAIDKILKNDYRWEDNNYDGSIPTTPFNLQPENQVGYPPGSNPPFLGDGNYNFIRRTLDNSTIGVYLTLIRTKETDNMADPHLLEAQYYPWYQCVIASSANSGNSHASVNRTVYRYQCPTLNYAVAAKEDINLNFLGGTVTVSYPGSPPPGARLISAMGIPNSTSWAGVNDIDYKRYQGDSPYDPNIPSNLQQDYWYPISVDYNFFYNVPPGITVRPMAGNIPSGSYDGIVFCANDVTVGEIGGGSVTINGSLIAMGEVKIRKGVSLTINSKNNQTFPNLYLPALVARSISPPNIGESSRQIDITGLVFSETDINIKSSEPVKVTGAIYAGGEINITAEAGINITYDPIVRLTSFITDNHPNRDGMSNNGIRFGPWQEVQKFK
ncbi:hypothetical protein A2276_03205 [candidate division WOR-1 bacterium RIFOXYA12_FULL_43_27]|uniref:Type 4 fimbrial biogenesis protein PilX N-terminal domain-containing protein n=1 Tax=candidate division WOR-1 bacterium RIFOXYC2_FULL_46_14 TaxID=1802587 RepID=A0A1F4U7T0_UNCSA|nr:MAG: hypothetical protein A2276_03205 [candidate division WOR-1 bacterium RIFOXYA12_FULL_43_27]OGC19290.1 MAG: hypothetical protein A2292_01130 [candidate division WOR-1 bacterium RIFOXYB2_FULL_46_45]OGC30279.1 MAG: hypothetical protein A2232_01130 [candidate division WOR-1 bacterium RIFOXYA2_FULL_46_56]OGC40880.1 MAG: hypothetical protein A2438_01130 [candidate division WOR-1 bacterium RIFOXYC2_FULL_46_14]